MPSSYMWSPFALSAKERRIQEVTRRQCRDWSSTLDVEAVDRTADALTAALAPYVGRIIERDSLPHLCHVVNGWGNALFGGQPLIDRYDWFIQNNERNKPSILQCDPEGDFHAGQSLAYAAMAGLSADTEIGARKVRLVDLVRNSTHILKEDAEEFGHLLFAIAFLDPLGKRTPYLVGQRELPFSEVVTAAINAHFEGHFDVCRKFHLTEGICAIASKMDGFSSFREQAQRFLDGQLEALLVLVQIKMEIERLVGGKGSAKRLEELRDLLVVGSFIENEYYYVGHAGELAAFAAMLGYQVRKEFWGALGYLINHLNESLYSFLPRVSLEDNFLHFGHYRRGITLLGQLVRSAGLDHSRMGLEEYNSNFDDLAPPRPSEAPMESPLLDRFYQTADAQRQRDEHFESIISMYSSRPGALSVRGTFDHFRRLGPPHWSRSVHYEFICYDNEIGTEIHLESDEVVRCQEILVDAFGRMQDQGILPDARWDPTWSKNRGRLQVLHPRDRSPLAVVEAMDALIRATYQPLDAFLHSSKSSDGRRVRVTAYKSERRAEAEE